MKTFCKRYVYKKDTPEYPKGWEIKFDGRRGKYYPYIPSEWKHDKGKKSIYLDYEHGGYSIKEIENEEWFTAISDPVRYIPDFPKENKINDFTYLDLETRLTDDVDECRALNELFSSTSFKKDLYSFVRNSYNKFHNLNNR